MNINNPHSQVILPSTIITIVIIPLIRRKVSSEKLAEIEKWVRIAAATTKGVARRSKQGVCAGFFSPVWV